ncbi:MAG: division/cell wall cluster transcriptional repressor MraZ [Dehalococcoidia bacterium]|nr:division/cell wall cluster transcriptional repressor MraZ [Dehalococcoidia bacterium]
MFLGEYAYVIDQKGRLAIPPRFREAFRDGLVLARGFDKCILIYPMAEWKEMAQSRASLPPTRSSVRRANRYTFSGAFDLELDKQGRVLVPSALRDYSEIRAEVVVLGLYNYLEIWARETWENEKSQMSAASWQIGESVEYRE